jgi:hypothetical protein
MMNAARQGTALQSAGTMTLRSEASRIRIITACSAYGALGWVIAEIAYELLLGPHIRLLRTLAIGSGVGAAVGLLTSTLQWSVLRHYVGSAGRWVVATTVGYTLGGLLAGFLLYQAIELTDLFRSTLGVQGIISSGISGLAASTMQWPVLRGWIGPGLSWRSWIVPVTVGSALAAPVAWLAGVVVLALLALTIGDGAWPVVIAGSYLAAGLAGSVVYSRFLALGFRRVLPEPNGGQIGDR